MNILVVGAGIVGLSAAWALASDGHEVTVLDQGPIPNPASASFDQHRMIRPHYGSQTGYTRMLPAAFAAWDHLWDDLNVSHYAETGVLAINFGDDAWMKATRAAFVELATPYEHLASSEIAVRAPMLHVEKSTWGLFAPKAGVLFADRIVTSLAHWLEGNGVKLLSHRKVCSVDLQSASIVLADGDRLTADKLIIAAGAWVSDLIPDLSNKITPVRSVVAYVTPPTNILSAWQDSPALFLLTKNAQLYALPPVSGTALKFGGAPILKAGDPHVPLSVSQDDQDKTLSAFVPYLESSDQYRTLSGAGGHYADPHNKRFVIQQHNKALVITGCGGRMFKFGALFGLRVADWVRNLDVADDLMEWAAGMTGE